ncbi:MAG: hypothetical protein K2P80_01295 [Beijerinckiaceae bacterium]|nr:hypothetical protein [Beijerinckiaceae bacterium]
MRNFVSSLIARSRLLLAALVAVLCLTAPAAAQLYQFKTDLLSTTPITFSLGNGITGTVKFTGSTAGSSGLSAPTVSGLNLVSNFLLIQPGTIATVSFTFPLAHLDLQWGPGNTVTRTDNFVFNTAQQTNIALPLASNLATRSAAFSGTGLDIVSFSFSSTSASATRLGVLTSTAPVPAPLDPVGATLLGNLVAIGAVAAYRRRRKRAAAVRPVIDPEASSRLAYGPV